MIVIEISLVIISFGLLAYFESQSTLIGNSINIAGKNRFLTSNVILESERYFTDRSIVSDLNEAMNELDSNIRTLKMGGTIAGTELRPLPSEYESYWQAVNERWQELQRSINQKIESYTPGFAESAIVKMEIAGRELVSASDTLVGQMSEGAREKSEHLVQMQVSLLAINVAVHALMLYLIVRIVRPIFAITRATEEIKKGNLNVAAVHHGNGRDEISALASSFNEMVDRLKRYDSMQKDFIGITSHELKGPIQPILGYVQLSKEGQIEQQEALDGIMQLAKKLQQVANDMLDVSKMEAGIQKYNFTKVNVRELAREIVATARINPLLKQDVTIDLVIPDEQGMGDLLYIDADRQRLDQALTNVINNAIKFTAARGTIRVTVLAIQELDRVRIEIDDDGAGIPEDILPRLFEKFVTFSSAKSDISSKGTGLGLYITKAIIVAHGGQISAANNDKGGATFTIDLPMSHAPHD